MNTMRGLLCTLLFTTIMKEGSGSTNVGSVKSYDNVNIRFTGINNVGTLVDNSNLILYAIASSLKIVDNQNCNFNFEESNIKVVDNQNCNFNLKESSIRAVDNQNMISNGKKNELKLEDNQNVEILGDLNKWTLEDNQNAKVEGTQNEGIIISNQNFKYKGNNGKSSYSDNTNTKVCGNNNEVMASNNMKLKIEGDNHQLTVSDTSNHVLKTVSDTSSSSSENLVRIEPRQLDSQSQLSPPIIHNGATFIIKKGGITIINNGKICTIQGSRMTCSSDDHNHKTDSSQKSGMSVIYHIDYVQKATISGNEYNLGIFKLYMERKDDQIQVIFDNSNLDANSFHIVHSSIDKYTMAGSKDGKKEMLSIIGPAVIARTEQADLLHVNLISNSAN